MRTLGMSRLVAVVTLAAGAATSLAAQEPETTTREAVFAQAQAEKFPILHPYVPGKAEALFNRAEDILVNGIPRWHPFFESEDRPERDADSAIAAILAAKDLDKRFERAFGRSLVVRD